jgi:long-subunit acyl-CoA synthetase (AMP-forming)
MLAWLSDLTARERRTMGACFGGWALDAFDVQMYSLWLVPLPVPGLDQPALLSWTSGTAGSPKAFLLTHRNIATNIEAFQLVERHWKFLPSSYIA